METYHAGIWDRHTKQAILIHTDEGHDKRVLFEITYLHLLPQSDTADLEVCCGSIRKVTEHHTILNVMVKDTCLWSSILAWLSKSVLYEGVNHCTNDSLKSNIPCVRDRLLKVIRAPGGGRRKLWYLTCSPGCLSKEKGGGEVLFCWPLSLMHNLVSFRTK